MRCGCKASVAAELCGPASSGWAASRNCLDDTGCSIHSPNSPACIFTNVEIAGLINRQSHRLDLRGQSRSSISSRSPLPIPCHGRDDSGLAIYPTNVPMGIANEYISSPIHCKSHRCQTSLNGRPAVSARLRRAVTRNYGELTIIEIKRANPFIQAFGKKQFARRRNSEF